MIWATDFATSLIGEQQVNWHKFYKQLQYLSKNAIQVCHTPDPILVVQGGKVRRPVMLQIATWKHLRVRVEQLKNSQCFLMILLHSVSPSRQYICRNKGNNENDEVALTWFQDVKPHYLLTSRRPNIWPIKWLVCFRIIFRNFNTYVVSLLVVSYYQITENWLHLLSQCKHVH